MDPITLMAIISGVTSLGSSIVNYASNHHNNQLQQDIHHQDQQWNQQMAAQANNWSIEQWNRENQYNSPQAQMDRLKSAGINPALAYSNGLFNQAATSPNVQMPENGQRAVTLPWQTDPMLMSNLYTASSQQDLMAAQSEAIRDENRRQNELQSHRIELTDSQVSHFNALSSYLSELESYTKENKELTHVLGETATLDFIKKQSTLGAEVESIKSQSAINKVQAEKISSLLQGQINLLRAQAKEALSRSDLNDKQKEYLSSLIKYYDDSLTALNTSQANLNDALSGVAAQKEKYYGFDEFLNAVGMGCNVIRTGLDAYSTIVTRGSKPDIIIGSSSASNLPYPTRISGGSFSSSRNGTYTVTGNHGGSILSW